MAWAEQQFHRYLLEGAEAEAARRYLHQRSIREESILRFQIGYAPNQWQWLTNRARGTQYSPEVLEALGLVIRNDSGRLYDRFRGRVMFPIRDTQDRPIAVGGRILPGLQNERTAKYINSPETRLYSKGEQLYALNSGRKDLERQRKRNELRHVVVMEGYTDVVVAKQEGIEAPVAVCGTALGPRHINLLKRYADRVTLVLDGDAAGKKRAAEVLELFIAGQIEVPCGYSSGRPGILASLCCNKVLIISASLSSDLQTRWNTASITRPWGSIWPNDTQRANSAMQRILTLMARAPRLKSDTNTTLRLREQQTLSRLARMFLVDEPLLRQQLSSLRSKAAASRQQFDTSSPTLPRQALLHNWEKQLFTLLIQCPEAISTVVEKVAANDMRTDAGKSLLSAYLQLEESGDQPEYRRLMGFIEEPALKNLLVELADDADRSQTADADLELRELLAAFSRRREMAQRREHMAELQSGQLAEKEELELLNRVFELRKLESNND